MSNKARPFLRWAGGKRWLIKYLTEIIGNTEYNNYFEPFIGGGSIFFHIEPKNAFISDTSEELINAYNQVKLHPEKIIELLNKFRNTKEEYYRIRETEPRKDIDRAARFIYLNKTSYNGIYRVNLKGKYNVPYGFRKTYVIGEENIMQASEKLLNAKIKCMDFMDTSNKIQKKDLVFLDPPYTVSHNNNGFIAYNQKIFSLEDQYRLSKYIDNIKERGAYYILTNAAHKRVKEIFDKKDTILELPRSSTIGGKYAKRQEISEYIFTNIIRS